MVKDSLPSAFVSVLEALTAWLESEHVPHTTIGGIAVSLIAQPRATQDIDAVIWLDESLWESLLKAGAAYDFMPRLSDALQFAKRSRVLLLKHQESDISIDLSIGSLEFEREMIERAILLEIGTLKIRVATPEDLIIAKAVAQRPKDIADIDSILSTQSNLDFARIRYWIQEFANVLEMPEIQESVESLLQRKQLLDKSSSRK